MDFQQLYIGFNIAGILIGLLYFIQISQKTYPFKEKWMIWWLLAIVLHQCFYLVVLNSDEPVSTPFALAGFPLAMLHLPLFYLSIAGLAGNSFSSWRAFRHLIPYLGYVFVLLLYHYVTGNSIWIERGYLNFPAEAPSILRYYNGVPIAISGVVYSFLSLALLSLYRKKIKTTYSNLELVDLDWIKNLVVFIITFFISIFVVIQLSDNVILQKDLTFQWVSILLTCFVAYFGYRYNRQVERFLQSKMERTKIDKAKYEKSGLTPAQIQTIAEKIDDALAKDKVYLNEELTISALAEHIGISSQKISETINRHYQSSFYRLVNQYRIEEAKLALMDTTQSDHLSIEGIGFDAGFKSKSTFFKLFKKETGLTPSQFKNSQSTPSRSADT